LTFQTQGDHCGNQRLQNKKYPRLELFKTEGRGFGLRTLEDIPQDALVQEYIGEVHTADPLKRGVIDYKTSMITDEEPLRGLLFY
jgi:hypothetical protein